MKLKFGKNFIIFVLVSLIFISTFGGSRSAYAAGSEIVWLLHTGTALAKTDGNFEFQLGDFNHDGVQDLYTIKKNGTGSGSTEVHVLNGANNFSSFLLRTGTALEETYSNFEFKLGDYNRDGILDLYCIKKNGTSGTSSTEVHVLNGANNFSSYLLHTGTALEQTYSNFEFELGDYNKDGILDLYAIKKNGTGSGSTEVHVLNGANNFSSYLLHTGTVLAQTDSNFEFELGDYNADGILDLYAIKKNGTSSTEVHVVNGVNNFSLFLLQTATPLAQSDSNFSFLLGKGKLNVYCISRNGVTSTEVHIFGYNENKGEQIVSYAKQFLGTPYVYGGTTPSGFDCSGFTQYVYQHFNIAITRTTDTQINQGIPVSQSNLQLGDLVFPTSGHVGIYVGNNQIIHAPYPGQVVKIETIWSFYAGRRILN
jgi:hypothetical protein